MNAIAEKTTNATSEGNQTAKPDAKKPRSGRQATAVTKAQSKVAPGTKLQPLAEGESAATSTRVIDDNTVETTYGFKLSGDAKERYKKTTRLDFSKVSRHELLQLATSNVRITIQGRLRAMGEAALQHNALGVVDVKSEVVDAVKQTTDDLTKAARSIMRASGGMISEADALQMIKKQLEQKSNK